MIVLMKRRYENRKKKRNITILLWMVRGGAGRVKGNLLYREIWWIGDVF